jgi:hypothetical protein
MSDKREALADYLDKRIEITGVFDKFSYQTSGVRQWRSALLQDVYALVDGKELDIGHVWLQNAEPLKNFNFTLGDRIRCNCRVTKYKKHLRVPNKEGLMVVNSFNLSWPTEIEVISRVSKSGDDPGFLADGVIPATNPIPASHGVGTDSQTLEQAGSINPVAMVLEVQRLAQRVGGWDALHQLVEALRPQA